MENNNKQTDFGAMIGIIIVIIVLLVGACYFIGQRIEKQKEFQETLRQGEIITASTSSDEISDIENYAASMNFDDLGSEIDSL